jgi:hypothetical protein
MSIMRAETRSIDDDDAELDVSDLLTILIGRPSWHADAACKTHPKISWFPGRGDDQSVAKKICEGCPVQQQCLNAGNAGQEHGVWGGLNRTDRQRLQHKAA